jgi:aminopeptidase N
MQHTLLGANKFRKGMDLYFERHDGQAVTIDDFVAAMEDANNVDLSQFKRWYSQAGTPQIKAKAVIDSGTLTLTLSQFCKATPGQDEKLPFYIPIKLAIFSSAGQPYDIQQELIILNEEKHTYEFHDIEDGAVVSLLRDFSAPVSLSFNQKDDDLRLLIEFETDGFARFEAMYKLQKRVLHELLKQADRGEQLQFNSDMAELYTKLLQQSDMDMALKAELLQPLSFEEIVSELKQIDVAQVMSVRDFYLDNLAEHCREEMLSHYLSLAASADNSGARKLKNVLLSYLSRDSKNIKLLKQQFEQANNMTDEIAALSLIVNQGAEVADDAITAFYNKWSSQELVLDKWFTVQASADNPEVIQVVTSLMAHSDFHLSNPNKVRALISGFAMGNPRYFHTEAGYQILTDVICKLDKVNPQTAARLVTPLTRWQRYHPTLQSLMKTALTQILSVENLSKDVFEVVSKSLDVSESAA